MPSTPSLLRRGALSGLCVAAVLTLSACGPAGQDHPDRKSASKTPTSAKPTPKPAPFAGQSGSVIANKAIAATRGVSSLTIKGEHYDRTDGTMIVDLALNKKGDCAGTMSLAGGSIAISKSGSATYLKFDEKFLRAQNKGDSKEVADRVVGVLADRWVKADSLPDAKDFEDLCDLDSLLGGFEGKDTGARKGSLTTVDGSPAITLTETEGKDTYTMDVATEGKPYMLRIVIKGSEPATMTFGDFGKPVRATTPAEKDIVDLEKLGG